jgi:hypothetical protein
MNFSYLFLYGILVISPFIGVVIFRRLPHWDLTDRLVAACTPFCGILLIGIVIRMILKAPFMYWNEPRLAPIFALTRGYRLYYGPDSGPALCTMYGPLTALAYLPVTIFHSPTIIFLLAGTLSTAFFFLPILWLHIDRLPYRSPKFIYGLWGFICFGLFIYHSLALGWSAFSIHADAPALGFSALACYALYQRRQKDRLTPFIVSALSCVLAVWTKQTLAPLVLALPVYLWLAEGRRSAVRYALCLLTLGSAISLLFFWWLGRDMIFGMFTIPSHTPWFYPPVEAFLWATRLLFSDKKVPFFWSIVIFYVWYLYKTSKSNNVSEWLEENRWALFAIVSLFLIPTALLTRVKVGGEVNANSLTLYFLLASVTLLLSHTAAALPEHRLSGISRGSKYLLIFLVAGAASADIYHLWRGGWYGPSQLKRFEWDNIKRNPPQIAYEFAAKHPNEVYFPWYPLVTLLADGKLYHFDDGVSDRAMAGFPMTPEHVRANLPSHMRYVVEDDKEASYVRRYLPEFSKRVILDDLAGWYVYERQNPLQ